MGLYHKGENWFIDYRVNGRRKREKIGPSKKLAETVLKKRKVEIAEGKYLNIDRVERLKFRAFAPIYLEIHAKPNKRSWQTTDAKYLKNLVPFFGERFLSEITTEMVERYKAHRKEAVSVASVNRELALLKCMFNKAITWGYANANPVRGVKLFKENNWRTRFLEKEEIGRLLSSSPTTLRAILIVALNTGMRKGEIQNLKWRDVDFERSYITVTHSKNGEKRFIPMNEAVKKALIGVRKHPESAYIFAGGDGEPFNFRKAFETALRKSGIKDFRFHDCRHTFASHLVMSGVDLNTVRELLGHKEPTMTLRYSHLSPDHKSRAVEILNRRMDTFWTLGPNEEKKREVGEVVSSLELVSSKNLLE